MKILITPSTMFNPGTAQRLLAELNVGPTLTQPDGKVRCKMTQAQFDMFRLRGGAHGVEIVPDAPLATADRIDNEPVIIIVDQPTEP